MCDRRNSSPVLFPTFEMRQALSFSSNQWNHFRAVFYLSLPFKDVSSTHLRTSMERAFVLLVILNLGEVLHWKILICIELTVYPQRDFKQSGGWKIECTDWCSLRGHSNERNGSKYKEWTVFGFVLDTQFLVWWPNTLVKNPFKTQFES